MQKLFILVFLFSVVGTAHAAVFKCDFSTRRSRADNGKLAPVSSAAVGPYIYYFESYKAGRKDETKYRVSSKVTFTEETTLPCLKQSNPRHYNSSTDVFDAVCEIKKCKDGRSYACHLYLGIDLSSNVLNGNYEFVGRRGAFSKMSCNRVD